MVHGHSAYWCVLVRTNVTNALYHNEFMATRLLHEYLAETKTSKTVRPQTGRVYIPGSGATQHQPGPVRVCYSSVMLRPCRTGPFNRGR